MTATTSPDPIVECIHRWHAHIEGGWEGGFDTLLHEDCVFLSPIVFTPQVGREVTKLYLTAAGGTLGGGNLSPAEREAQKVDGGGFRYTKEILDGHHAMLEFETTMGTTAVNGVDIITCDDDAMITEFRVMVRPLQAVNVVHEQMMAMLEKLGG